MKFRPFLQFADDILFVLVLFLPLAALLGGSIAAVAAGSA